MNARLLLVERSSAMRQVLGEHLTARGFDIDETSSYVEGIARLDRRFGTFRGDYSGVVLGWPAGDDADVGELLARLEQDDLADLPVVVMSTDLRAETRAWVAGREHARMIGWNRYRDIDRTLDALPIGIPKATAAQATDAPANDSPLATAQVPPTASASTDGTGEIHLLVVDDSATIRRSLQDLFTPQGYVVSLASNQQDALELARRRPIDIAIVDFYLEEGTGDEIVSELAADVSTSHVVCAVLTGTYTDHIIRRSLRAGALECLFKNEASELLLSRMAALSRLVMQRRKLVQEHHRLHRVFDVVAGAALVLDAEGTVRHVSSEAMTLLGHAGRESLVPRPITEMVGQVSLPPTDGEMHRCDFVRADGSFLEMVVEHRPLVAGLGSVLQFAPYDALQSSGDTGGVVDVPSPADHATLAPSADRFIALLDRCLAGKEPTRAQRSLLIVGVWLPGAGKSAESLGEHPDLYARLTPLVMGLYRRTDHVAELGKGRYGFVLRHADEPQSWMLTRKLMKTINAALEASGERRLATAGVLKPLGSETSDARQMVEHYLGVLERVEARGLDSALLVGPRRLLRVYPQAPD